MRVLYASCGIAMSMVVCGCAATPARQPTSTVSSKSASDLGFTASCPDGWKPVNKGGEFVFAAVPHGAGGGDDDDPLVAIQLPQLPLHIPGFIPLTAVASGYVQDLKKRDPNVTIDEQTSVKLDGANASRIGSSFRDGGKPWRELALLAVHGDHVYVITGNSDATSFGKTKTAFDALLASFKWTGKS